MQQSTKVLISVLSITVLIIFLGITTTTLLDKSIKEMDKSLERIENCIYSKDLDSAKKYTSEMEELLNKNIEIWSTYIDHCDLQEVDICVSKLKKFIDKDSTSSALAECYTARKLLSNIADKEKVKLVNIF